MTTEEISRVLSCIDPDESYQKWVGVGMALKKEGLPLAMWEDWSRNGQKYHEGECAKKWTSFNEENGGAPVTMASVVQWAKQGGYVRRRTLDRDWGFTFKVTEEDFRVLDPAFVESDTFREPSDEDWNPVSDFTRYINALFRPDEYVGIAVKSFQGRDEKWHPLDRGNDRTASKILEDAKRYKSMNMIIGTTSPEAGAWVRINPLDGKGGKNANVTSYRYALVESDKMSLGKQEAIIRELQVPVAAMVYSGGKSIHSIVKIGASDFAEYKQRVNQLYDILGKNGFEVDTQNKNPSRYSRLPGVMRGERKQFLIATNIGRDSFDDWLEYIHDQTDNLPPITNVGDVWQVMPPLAPEIIQGVLRQGHKMMLAAPSKAGKSFLMIELAIAIAEGRYWLEDDERPDLNKFLCKQGRVLYVNLEIDEASCLHRIKDVYQARGIPPDHLGNFDVWNLRGDSAPLTELVPMIIRHAKERGYIAFILDPIYKVLTGDENSAGDMARFCNQFDILSKQLGVACIYSHHHSKGAQGNKRAIDRASGSGVFARDPDALLDMTPIDASKAGIENAYRMSGVLREFASFDPFELYFDWPIHRLDKTGLLADVPESGNLAEGQETSREVRTAKKTGRQNAIICAIKEAQSKGEKITQKDLAEQFGVTKMTISRDLNEIGIILG